jgi:hypothetical protein
MSASSALLMSIPCPHRELHKAVHEDSPWPESPGDDDDPDKLELISQATIPAPPTINTFSSNSKEMPGLELSEKLHAEGKIAAGGPPFYLIDHLGARGVFEIATKESGSVERRATEMECF